MYLLQQIRGIGRFQMEPRGTVVGCAALRIEEDQCPATVQYIA